MWRKDSLWSHGFNWNLWGLTVKFPQNFPCRPHFLKRHLNWPTDKKISDWFIHGSREMAASAVMTRNGRWFDGNLAVWNSIWQAGRQWESMRGGGLWCRYVAQRAMHIPCWKRLFSSESTQCVVIIVQEGEWVSKCRLTAASPKPPGR